MNFLLSLIYTITYVFKFLYVYTYYIKVFVSFSKNVFEVQRRIDSHHGFRTHNTYTVSLLALWISIKGFYFHLCLDTYPLGVISCRHLLRVGFNYSLSALSRFRDSVNFFTIKGHQTTMHTCFVEGYQEKNKFYSEMFNRIMQNYT